MSTILVIFLSVLFNLQHSEFDSHEFSVEVKVDRFQPGKGLIRVCIFDSEDTFFNNAMACEVKETPGAGQSISLPFSQKFPSGKYAIAVYQDLNQNGILDRNWLGLPVEPYGFSNNPSTFFGPPSFHKAAFDLTGDHSLKVSLQGWPF
jgi:uncharacterized protein (DUF2141 family)